MDVHTYLPNKYIATFKKMVSSPQQYTIRIPQQLLNDQHGYKILATIAGETLLLRGEEVLVDFSACINLNVNLCSILGNVLQALRDRGNKITIKGITIQVLRQLGNNPFLSEFDYTSDVPSNAKRSIPYKRFNLSDENEAKEFFEAELFEKQNMPQMSDAARKAVLRNIFEVCVNAITHAGCDFVYCCGEIIETQINPKVVISFVDLGKTITANVMAHLNVNLTGNQAISWALKEGNTTKSGNEPGGLGLKLLQDLINLNKGKLQIVSGNGFIEMQNGLESAIGLGYSSQGEVHFPGTVVTLEIKLGDPNVYSLAEETNDTSNLF